MKKKRSIPNFCFVNLLFLVKNGNNFFVYVNEPILVFVLMKQFSYVYISS